MSRVCVIGGGPAGAVFALRMAALGHQVTLVERAAFPRRTLGEVLTPGVRPLLETVDASDAMDAAGALRIPGVRHLWAGSEEWRADPGAQGATVDRGRFDAHLLALARKAGVEVLQPARVVRRAETEGGWSLSIATGENTMRRETDFLADATGRSGNSAAHGPRTVAAFCYWRLPAPLPEACMEAGEEAWFWGVPLPGGLYNTLVVCRPETLRAARGAGLAGRVAGLLGRSRLLPDLSGALPDGPVGAADATPRHARDTIGARFIRIGDAALALDPISSSGVQKAIRGALAAAVTANTLLRRPELAAAAKDYYAASLRDTADRHVRWSGAHYAAAAATRPHPFWQERAASAEEGTPVPQIDEKVILTQPVRLAPETRIGLSPCLQADHVALRPAVTHPGLDGAVAYMGGHEIAPLLQRLDFGTTPIDLARSWGDRLPLKPALAIIVRLMESGVIVPTAKGEAQAQR